MTNQYLGGIHAVTALLNNPHRQTKKLWFNALRQDTVFQQIIALAQAKNILVESMSVKKMEQHFPQLNHQGIVAEAAPLFPYTEKHLTELLSQCTSPPFLLILDTITDPHNLGACLRTADAAGVNFVIIPKDKSAAITPVVSKVACGAAESVPLMRVTNLVRTIEQLKEKGVWVYGAAGEATQSIYTLDCCIPLAIILGAEGDGLRRLTREHCDELFYIPMQGSVESLNVSVAAGIASYEVVRQRYSSQK